MKAITEFNELVELAMKTDGLATMRPVVEKELLHYEIFNALDSEALLKDIVFQGGTSLRLCHGGNRFSEDLDFVGGRDFDSTKMSKIKQCIETHIGRRYALQVEVGEPRPNTNEEPVKVAKWTVSVITSPDNPSMPRQRIKIEIANIPAYTRELMPIHKNYDFLSGTRDVLVPTESLSEILADKIVAFPNSLFNEDETPVETSSGKIRHRDLWDIAWLLRNRSRLDAELVTKKQSDYKVTDYTKRLRYAIEVVPLIVKGKSFNEQMSRFIDSKTFNETLAKPEYLDYLSSTIAQLLREVESTRVADQNHRPGF